MINEFLAYNKQFVTEKAYEPYVTTKYPDKKVAIVSVYGYKTYTITYGILRNKEWGCKDDKKCRRHHSVTIRQHHTQLACRSV